MKKILIVGIALLLLTTALVSAHVPYIAKGNSTIVDDPTQSRAFYGTVKNTYTYEIPSNEDFLLYVQILAPYKENKTPNVDFKIYKEEQLIENTKQDIQWEKYYEEYARDYYWKSNHEFEENVSAGNYTVKVIGTGDYSLTMNEEPTKYSLAIGKQERFTIKDWVRTFINAIRNKAVFFR